MTEMKWEYEHAGDWTFRVKPSGWRSKGFEWCGEAKRGEFSADNILFDSGLFDGIHINHGSTKRDVLRKLKAECLS